MIKYENDFFLIPKSALMFYNFLTTKTQVGKTRIYCPYPNHAFFGFHWTSKYFISKDSNFAVEFNRITMYEQNRQAILNIKNTAVIDIINNNFAFASSSLL